jgi:DNA-binding CsgD family transcriptional regulator
VTEAAARRRSERGDEAKSVAAAHNLRRKYGLTVDVYTAMVDTQQGACAICRVAFGAEVGRRPHVDHDHSTGAVRGILCFRCNTAIGKLRDDPALLANAIAYLQAPPPDLPLVSKILSPSERSEAARGRRRRGDLVKRRVLHSASVRGERNPAARLTAHTAAEIRLRYAAGGVSQRSLAEEFGCSQGMVSGIVRGRAWMDIA